MLITCGSNKGFKAEFLKLITNRTILLSLLKYTLYLGLQKDAYTYKCRRFQTNSQN